MNWIVFGDDWGRHPSTTQHLARHLAEAGGVIWFDSIGMRSPGLGDLGRVAGKVRSLLSPRPAAAAATPTPPSLVRTRPAVLPWHLRRAAAAWNGRALARAVGQALGPQASPRTVILASNPVAGLYLDRLPRAPVIYLRLDDYARLPGVDPALAEAAEATLIERADLVVATARGLLPAQARRAHYLPQGVDVALFGEVPLAPPAEKVLGFFGLLAPWVDVELMAAVARANPDWTLELGGRWEPAPGPLRGLPNVRFLPPVPYRTLPAVLARWRAAWVPFRISQLTAAVNPLKLRESLAAGLPTFSTPLPEVALPEVVTGTDEASVSAWLRGPVLADDAGRRQARRASVARDGWDARAAELAGLARQLPGPASAPLDLAALAPHLEIAP